MTPFSEGTQDNLNKVSPPECVTIRLTLIMLPVAYIYT